jgi:hypothetical protein
LLLGTLRGVDAGAEVEERCRGLKFDHCCSSAIAVARLRNQRSNQSRNAGS